MIKEIEKRLLGFINKDELVRLTQDLVRIDSVIRPETGNTEAGVVRFIADWIQRELGVKPLVQEVVPLRENIIVTIDSGKPGPCLMFEGHTDVVSEGNKDLWQHDPFGGEIHEGKIYGRGSCDMKAGLAVNLLTVKAMMKSKIDFKGKMRLGIVCDEEDLMLGIQDYIKKGHADDVDACLVSEPEENQLCLSMKGALRAIVKVKGKMAHGAMPLTGINTSVRMARIILAFEAFEKAEMDRCGKDEFLGWPSVTFTVVQSPPPGEPTQLNVMPSESVGYVDIRTIPGQAHEQIKMQLKEILNQLAADDPDLNAQIEFIADKPVVSMEKDEPIVMIAAEAYTDITGREPVYNGVPGATDGTFLRDLKGIPSLVNGPGPRHLPHQTDEYVQIEEMFESLKIYLLTTYRFLNRT
ncbi:MAG: M20 family metallopeptidase [Desulfobacula sp.]|mgnify:FL=1|jgi:succinyl-diaminopimelate desuccinylase|uniref:M20 family metallopeptidase n=1 Tax=Desulfobacula sp. TaxID=2593537 RepID=UPI001E0272D4|nr:M20 family metallopeptidase [Desulfobacula sp.]MBT3485606.1 M20 family metallopeptidase [Desulfobacula sp.]MBT3805782.1 M20 family metallopeptidase [Desulfobacula sp.]MBT4024778.1 M20 family metallopeptidase [Desulfobacula sp.]MBT4200218.1 M20 family metallopeptidase [Desulfobacula sp.]